MLQKLIIKNYILIDEVELNLQKGLTCITGETGAGKSILLGALALILGKRAESTVHFNQNKKCIVEGHFSLGDNPDLKKLFISNDWDFHEYSILRRELLPSGRSRAFVNDTPVQLSLLQDLSSKLVNISSQRDAQQLSDSNFVYSVLDGFADNARRLQKFRISLQEFRETAAQLKKLKEKIASLENERSFVEFQYNELASLNIAEEDELDLAKNRLTLLENSENLKSVLYGVLNSLESDENSVENKLNDIWHELQKVEDLNPDLKNFSVRLKSALISLQELSADISRFEEQFQFDNEELQNLRDRVSELYSALHKHKLQSLADLLGLQSSLESKLDFEQHNEKLLESVESKLSALESKLATESLIIFKARLAVKDQLEKAIISTLKHLGLEEATFKFNLQDPAGKHQNENAGPPLKILFSANSGKESREIAKAASGGEMSRVMLALKGSVAKKMALPCLIFDEIDTGISGVTAKRTGQLLAEMANSHQLIAITHLPQIAAMANDQFLVEKQKTGKRSQTAIRRLTNKERVSHIATMISGEMDSEAALLQAEELLKRQSE